MVKYEIVKYEIVSCEIVNCEMWISKCKMWSVISKCEMFQSVKSVKL